jgi:glucose-1-phosphate thymidylyltransferase
MVLLVLAAGYATRMYPLTENFPKPLLAVSGKPILDWLLDDIGGTGEIDRYIVISNHKYAARFADWAKKKRGLAAPIEVLDDGSIDNEHRLGAVRDIQFAIETCALDDDIMVIAGDNLLNFSLIRLIRFFYKCGGTSVMRYFEKDLDRVKRSGVIDVGSDNRITRMAEKPVEPFSRWCVPPFYIYARADARRVAEAICAGCATDAPGSFIAWLSGRAPVYAMEMPGKRYDIGDIKGYERVKSSYATPPAKYPPV